MRHVCPQCDEVPRLGYYWDEDKRLYVQGPDLMEATYTDNWIWGKTTESQNAHKLPKDKRTPRDQWISLPYTEGNKTANRKKPEDILEYKRDCQQKGTYRLKDKGTYRACKNAMTDGHCKRNWYRFSRLYFIGC